MKELNKRFITGIIIVGVAMGFLFCKTDYIISFESEEFNTLNGNVFKKLETTNDIYRTRIMTTVWLELIFKRFSKNTTFEKITITNIILEDDKGNEIEHFQEVSLEANGIMHEENGSFYQLYSFRIEDEALRIKIKKYKTKYILLKYEINGEKYSEKLKRVVEKYPILRT